MENSSAVWDAARARLFNDGFTHAGVIDPAQLPPAVARDANVAGASAETRLVLVASAGQSLWQALTRSNPGLHGDDPVDDFARTRVSAEFDQLVGQNGWELRYPGPGAAPLMALGQWLGWTQASPLGLGIHPQYGLWFAYRVLAVVQYPLPVDTPQSRPSPCTTCATRDCETACPPGAVTTTGNFNLARCMDFRDAPASPCAESCLARVACPAGASHRYTTAQFAYHQRRALDGMRRWRDAGPAD